MSSAGCSRFCAVICSSYIWRLHLILQPQEICSSSGSHVGLHEPFTSSLLRNLKVHSFFSFLLRLTEAGQAHVCVCVCVCDEHLVILQHAQHDAPNGLYRRNGFVAPCFRASGSVPVVFI
jgi:hypothetical protein